MTRWLFWLSIGAVIYLLAGRDYPFTQSLLALWFLITCIAMPIGIIVWLVSKR
jgi:hypothetical protein